VCGQFQEARIIFHGGTDAMTDHLGLLIIDQNLVSHSAKILETLNQAFIGVFGILAGHRHEVKTPRIT
jgi:hypothetical protein